MVLADDAVILRQGLARLLREEGFRVVGEAGDADELLRLVSELVPDVVVTDVRMPPGMSLDGLEAAIEIRGRHPDIGIMVSASTSRLSTPCDCSAITQPGWAISSRNGSPRWMLADALRRVAAGGTAVDPEVVRRSFPTRQR